MTTRSISATLNSKLVALDAKTGSIVWQTDIADPTLGYSETMAPTTVNGKILIGTSGGEYGIRGFVRAYDAETGSLVWNFDTTPREHRGSMDYTRRYWEGHASRNREPEKATLEKIGRPLQDARRRRVAEPGGRSQNQPHLFRRSATPSPSDFDGSLRPGDNLYTDSLVSVDVSIPANMPATSSTLPTMSGTLTRQAP